MEPPDLLRQQRFSLWLDRHEGLSTLEDAQGFLNEVGVALRYGPNEALPMASMFRATQIHVPVPEDETVAHKRAFELTNGMLAAGSAIEITVVGGRLALAQPAVMPAIYALRRRGRSPDDLAGLSPQAGRAWDLIRDSGGANAGHVRRHLGAVGEPRPDAADTALAELQRELLVDRGPSSAPAGGVFYLSKEGYPYRLLHDAHPEIPEAASALSREQAANQLLMSYLPAAVFAAPQKLRKLFSLLLEVAEIDRALTELVDAGLLERGRVGKWQALLFLALA